MTVFFAALRELLISSIQQHHSIYARGLIYQNKQGSQLPRLGNPYIPKAHSAAMPVRALQQFLFGETTKKFRLTTALVHQVAKSTKKKDKFYVKPLQV
ncbi:MAG: hypothetical protein KME59_09240 [Trichormus sp. ATA11-4-KO1]|nr:hypothetical protein [Trichormus sp. ATA11-4-KO1]